MIDAVASLYFAKVIFCSEILKLVPSDSELQTRVWSYGVQRSCSKLVNPVHQIWDLQVTGTIHICGSFR